MAGSGTGQDEQQLKRRAMRRLTIALALIAAAIAALALLDRYNAAQKKPEIPPSPPASQALPVPGEQPPTAQSPPPKPLPAAPPSAQPPPPPPVVSNETVIPPESARPAPKPGREAHEAAPPAAPKPTSPWTTEAPKSAAKPAEIPAPAKPPVAPAVETAAPKGYLVQVGVFSTPANAAKLIAKLAEKNIPSHTETRVVVGPFKDRAEADAVNQQIKGMGLQGIVFAPH